MSSPEKANNTISSLHVLITARQKAWLVATEGAIAYVVDDQRSTELKVAWLARRSSKTFISISKNLGPYNLNNIPVADLSDELGVLYLDEMHAKVPFSKRLFFTYGVRFSVCRFLGAAVGLPDTERIDRPLYLPFKPFAFLNIYPDDIEFISECLTHLRESEMHQNAETLRVDMDEDHDDPDDRTGVKSGLGS